MSQFDHLHADQAAFSRSDARRISRRSLLRGAAAAGIALPAAGAMGASQTGVVGAVAARQVDPTTLTIAMNGSPSDLDPHSVYDYRSAMPLRGPYEGLIALDGSATNQYVPVIAESWAPNENKSVWTFNIRSGVTFHDGTPVDAEAVRTSFVRFLTLGLGPTGAMRRFIQEPDQITAPDASTVVFDCGQPQPLFEAYMSSQYGPLVLNVNAVMQHEEDGDQGHLWAQLNEEGLGTGPYRIVEFEPEQQLVLERYDAYWGGWEGNHFDRVIFRVVPENETRRQLIEQGEVDIVDNLTPEAYDALAENPELFIDRSYSAEVDYIILTVDGALASPEARQAMCWAFPYDEVIDGVFKGYGKRAIGGVSELVAGFDAETFQYTTDLEKARELLAAAGVAEGAEITLTQETGYEDVRTAVQLFQQNLAEIGVALTINEVDLSTFTGIMFGDMPVEERPGMMPWFWWPDYNDAYNHLYPQIACDQWGSAGTNGGYYCNERVQELFDANRDEPDPEKYQAALSEIQQIISRDDPPAVYYMQRQWTTVLRNDIEGFYFNPINIGTFNFYRMSRASGG
jgi:peptide/nickel transport system substrate-binding protein